jgi:hypothetical protein
MAAPCCRPTRSGNSFGWIAAHSARRCQPAWALAGNALCAIETRLRVRAQRPTLAAGKFTEVPRHRATRSRQSATAPVTQYRRWQSDLARKPGGIDTRSNPRPIDHGWCQSISAQETMGPRGGNGRLSRCRGAGPTSQIVGCYHQVPPTGTRSPRILYFVTAHLPFLQETF